MAVASTSTSTIQTFKKFRSMLVGKPRLPFPTFEASFLVVAGGGAGGLGNNNHFAGGGAGGGYRSSWNAELSGGGGSAESPFAIEPYTDYTVTVGAGGAANGGDGNPSQLGPIICLAGGGGGNATSGAGRPGGSGGGGAGTSGPGGAGTSNQGFNGGNCSTSGQGAGGGGAGAAGFNNANLFNGGAGRASTITGSSVTRAAGATGNQTTSAGANNTGNGGGIRGGALPRTGFNGGSGIVVVRYPSSRTIIVGSGLTHSTLTIGSDKLTTFTAGTGIVSWDE